jgi:hypothetical protein
MMDELTSLRQDSNLRFLGCGTKNVRPHAETYVAQITGIWFNNLASRRGNGQRAERDGKRSYTRDIATQLVKEIYDNYSFAYTGASAAGHDNTSLRTYDSPGEQLKRLQLGEGEGDWTGPLMGREGQCLS